jgi:hypothetical protein
MDSIAQGQSLASTFLSYPLIKHRPAVVRDHMGERSAQKSRQLHILAEYYIYFLL